MAAPENPFLRAGDCSTRCYAFLEATFFTFQTCRVFHRRFYICIYLLLAFFNNLKESPAKFWNRNVEAIDPCTPFFLKLKMNPESVKNEKGSASFFSKMSLKNLSVWVFYTLFFFKKVSCCLLFKPGFLPVRSQAK